MNCTVRQILLVLLDVLLASAVLFVLPFCFILRDGMGHNATSSNGFEAIVRTLKTLYIGPTILVLAIFDLLLRLGVNSDSSRSEINPIVLIVLAIILLAGLSVGAMALFFGG